MSRERIDIVGSGDKQRPLDFSDAGIKSTNEDMLEKALEWIKQGRKVALSTVVETWGSSPRPVGSQLVIDATGAFEGSVSGGCIEGAVITEAIEVLEAGDPREICFGEDGDSRGWEIGLSCGGRVAIYIENANLSEKVLEKMMSLRRKGLPTCLITDLETGQKTVLHADDLETLQTDSVALQQRADDAIQRDLNTKIEINGRQHFFHTFNPALTLIIIGAVHISQPLAKMAQMTGYDVVIVDPREGFASMERFPFARLERDWPDEVMERMILHHRTAVVALTHDPKLDDPALIMALQSKVFYIGALGSKKTHARRLDRLKETGFSEEVLDRIHGPVGLSIGALSPAEIAVSILAEITRELRQASKDQPRIREDPCCMKDNGPVCNTITTLNRQ